MNGKYDTGTTKKNQPKEQQQKKSGLQHWTTKSRSALQVATTDSGVFGAGSTQPG